MHSSGDTRNYIRLFLAVIFISAAVKFYMTMPGEEPAKERRKRVLMIIGCVAMAIFELVRLLREVSV